MNSRKYLRFRRNGERIVTNTGVHIVTSEGYRIGSSRAASGPLLRFGGRYLSIMPIEGYYADSDGNTLIDSDENILNG